MTSQPLSERLSAGYRRFRAGRYNDERVRYDELARDGQKPRTLIIACSDSRSAPETIFDAGPGELFVVRNVAALVPIYAPDSKSHGASAALEFAVLGLEVSSIVVMGHGRCGGVAAALEPSARLSETDFIGAWVADLRALAAGVPNASPSAPTERQRLIEHLSVQQSLMNLRTFPWIAERERSGNLTLHGAWFDISLGELHALAGSEWLPQPYDQEG
ncbi:MAG: carbonic anhydrase [bacterium]